MKKFLHFLLLLVAAGISTQATAQANSDKCSVEQVGIQITSTKNVNGKCEVTANISFVALERNNGQKFFTIHLWEKGKRPALTFSAPPTAEDLAKDLRTIVIEDKGNGKPENRNWKLSKVYDGGNSNLVDNSDVTPTAYKVPEGYDLYKHYKGYTFFVLSGVTFTTTAGCNNMQLVADVWGSNTNNNKVVHCKNTSLNVFECTTQDAVSVFGDAFCGVSYQVGFSNTSGCNPYFVTYEVYSDVNGNGIVDRGEPFVSDGPEEDYAILFPGATDVKTRAYTGKANLIVTNINLFTFSSSGVKNIRLEDYIIASGCAVTPVKFASFTASRNTKNKQQVDLAWTTATEQNNRGFYVQRNTSGEWKDIAFVFSAADGGNSSTALSYSFKDVNASKGVTQYRLLQVDLDSKASFSEVKSVRGLEQAASVVVYPNPATNGKVNILFSDAGTIRDVVVSDINGRIVRRYAEVSNNQLTIEGLTSGFYTIKISDRKTAATVVEKVVVK